MLTTGCKFVILVQAGIQGEWLAAGRDCSSRGSDAISIGPIQIWCCSGLRRDVECGLCWARASWIPAFAGMTMFAGMANFSR